jgi:hypothetical protein
MDKFFLEHFNHLSGNLWVTAFQGILAECEGQAEFVQQSQLGPLKGLKHEIFEHGVFMQIRPERVTSELGQKILNIFGWGLIFQF